MSKHNHAIVRDLLCIAIGIVLCILSLTNVISNDVWRTIIMIIGGGLIGFGLA